MPDFQDISSLTLGLDFVGTISDSPEFFRILSRVWPGPVVIISGYDSVEELERDLEEFQIRYDKAIAVPHSMSKADIILEENVAFYFDDQVSNLSDVDKITTCFLIRNAGKFNDETCHWKIPFRCIDKDQNG